MDTEKEFMRAEEIAARLGLETSTFLSMVAKGSLPQGMLVTGGKLKRWRKEDVAGIKYLLDCIGFARFRKSTPDEEDRDAKDA